MTLIRVLVADDLAPLWRATCALLLESFAVVALVSDGHAALEGILKLEPDLAILDISMPGMNGIEVTRALKSRGRKTRIVFLTVHEDADILASCLDAGGLGYVVKRFMAADLIPALKEALADRVFASRFSSQRNTPGAVQN
jgi:two-component system response regulator NreC